MGAVADHQLVARHGAPVQITGTGSFLGVHFSPRPVRSIRDLAHPDPDMTRRRTELMKLLHLDMIAQGYYFARRGYITLSLPMQQADFDGLYGAFDEFLSLRGPVIAAAVA